MQSINTKQSSDWLSVFQSFSKPQVIAMLFLGFSAGLPLALIFGPLSLWLGEAGIGKSTVTYFSWAVFAYSFKFIWAPLIDRVPLPIMTPLLGRRRAWLVLSQILIIAAITLMAFIDPSLSQRTLLWMAFSTVFLGFSSATQDIVIDAYRIECADSSIQALLASSYIAGYRGGMIASGAGALFLAEYLGTAKGAYVYDAWKYTYFAMAGLMLIGLATSLWIKEPNVATQQRGSAYTRRQYANFVFLFLTCAFVFVAGYLLTAELSSVWKLILADLFSNSVLANFILESMRLGFSLLCVVTLCFTLDRMGWVERALLKESYWLPIAEYFNRYNLKLALLLLLLIGFYRISDVVLGVISYVFYQDMGFSKVEIATISKTFGLIMTLLGGFLGGVLSLKFGVMRILVLGAILTALTNLLFMWLAHVGHDVQMLYFVISADNISGGVASAAFVAFLARMTHVKFTAVQYAIFSSLMFLIPKTVGGYSGSIVENIGYHYFFLFVSLLGVPVIALTLLVSRKLESNSDR